MRWTYAQELEAATPGAIARSGPAIIEIRDARHDGSGRLIGSWAAVAS
ncbi:hypothetical protein ACWDUL_19850 [Nocardia niigatensis]|nr:hypothetical protein [Nocardia niigatensis]